MRVSSLRERLLLVCAAVGVATVTSVSPAGAIPVPTADLGALPSRFSVGPTQPTEQKSVCGAPFASSTTALRDPSPAQNLMQVSDAWRYSRGAGTTVAVIDTGVTPSARFARLTGGGDFVSTSDGLRDCDGHGTLVAGIIAGRPSARDGFAGVAPDAAILSIRQTSLAYAAKGSSSSSQDPSKIAASSYGTVQTLAYAVVTAVRRGADVINISEIACAPAGSSIDDRALGAAVRYAHSRGVVVVVAAGNLVDPCKTQNAGINPANPSAGGWDTVSTAVSPAYFSRYVLTVGGVVSETGAPSPISIHGPWVSVAAPATGIVSIGARGEAVDRQQGEKGPITIDGTSFAAPYVAGLAALIKSRFPGISADDVIRRITSSAHSSGSGRDTATGFGVIDPVAALSDQIAPAAAPGAARALPAPPRESGTDTATVVAAAGTGVCLAVGLAWWLLTIPRRRLRRLTEDDY
ncbi:type VII secretion-associated serine protease mycosin [Williamsia sp.]|uniref:type VII secretion-associated serine protease mycosin n=1 Tax=Williamsia sp. TaxID=1872085 RepID=UPI001A2A68A1|nr:type VII secretion-associated serine protease mycosin [Williamsia sp.]MBJ7290276.1 type VII secretion-associated serine protease mycosin [Williamsia sp.]